MISFWVSFSASSSQKQVPAYSLCLDGLCIDTAAIISNLDNDIIALLERIQEDSSLPRFSGLLTDIRVLNTMISGVT